MREGWAEAALGEVAGVTIGRQRAPRHATGTHLVPYLRAANVKDGRFELHDVLRMNFTPSEQAVFGLRAGDVLVTEGCGSIRELGASALWRGESSGTICFQNTLLRLRAVPGVTIPEFVALWARHAHAAGVFAGVASGTNIFHIGLRRARAIPVFLPPLGEQRRIADLVSWIDTASAAAEREMVAARALRMSLMATLVSVPVRDGEWPLVELGQLARLSLGFTKGERTGPLVDVPYLRAANLTFGELRLNDVAHIAVFATEAEKHRLKVDDLVLTEGGNPWDLGRGWIWDGQIDRCIHQNSVIRATDFAPEINPRFLAHTLETAELRRYFESRAAQTSGVAHLGKEGALHAPIPVPERAAQDRIVGLLDATLAVARQARQMRSSLSRLRDGVVTDLVSGARTIPASYDLFLDGAA
jgi:type I restriction enzyme, S subunit